MMLGGGGAVAQSLSAYSAYSALVTQLDKGVLLVANESLSDPRFRETIILLLEHSPQLGSRGLIINRRTDTKLADLIPEFGALDPVQRNIYLGGPLAGVGLNYLVREMRPGQSGIPIVDGVLLGWRERGLKAMLGGVSSDQDLRVYVGHCGWAAGQLQAEIEAGYWRLLRADAATVFAESPQRLWRTLWGQSRLNGLIVHSPFAAEEMLAR